MALTKDETKALLIKQGAILAKARVDAYAAELAIEAWQIEIRRLADQWAGAAADLIEQAEAEVAALSSEEQWECFVEGCRLAGVDPDHEVFNEERQTFDLLQAEERSGNPELN